MAAVLMAGTVAGCGDSGSGNTSGNSSSTSGGKSAKEVTVSYAGWEDPVMALELAEKFNERYPNIKVEIINDGEWRGTDWMSKKAATGELPDIVNVENIAPYVQNGWLADMNPYFEKDKDAATLPENMAKYGNVNDKLIMLPGSVYIYGVMLNKDLLTANGLAIPDYEWTMDEFTNIVKTTTKKGATIGVNEVQVLMKHLQAQENPEVGWGNFNETTKKYELGETWQKTVNVTKDLMDANVSIYEDLDAQGNPGEFEEGSAEQNEVNAKREQFLMDLVGETDSAQVWYKGKAALWMDFTWSTGFTTMDTYSGFDWDFYPIPSITEGKTPRTPFVVDSIGITESCKNPEAAYEFVKYLSFAKEGIEDRMQIVEEYDKDALMEKYPDLDAAKFANPLTFNQIPSTTDQATIDKWVEFTDAKPGIQYMLEKLADGYADGYKVTPGFDEAYHQTVEKVVREQVFTGQKTAADLATELAQKADEITQKAYDSMK